jgi:hypothetical protein
VGYFLEPVYRKTKMFPHGFPPNFEPSPWTPKKPQTGRGGWNNGTIPNLSAASALALQLFKDRQP